jgi:hypothetical protein
MMKIIKTLPWKSIVLLTALLFVFAGCAVTGQPDPFTREFIPRAEPYSFVGGFFHGAIMPLGFVGSICSSYIEMYATNHVKGWYDLGYMMGVVMAIGGGIRASLFLKNSY